MKTQSINRWSYNRALIRPLQVENRWGAPPNSPDLNLVDYSIWEQLVYCHRRIQEGEHLKEVVQTCCDWSRRYRSRYMTVSQMIVARCCNWWRTHWAPLWLMFLVLHIHYHTCFVVEIQNLDNKSKESGLFCATLYIITLFFKNKISYIIRILYQQQLL